MKPLFIVEHCSSCGLELNSHMKENKDYFVENDGQENYCICKDCKNYWDKVESR